MKGLSSKLYNKEYYLNTCCGSDEFVKYQWRKVHPQIENYVKLIGNLENKIVLDIGCGRGDLAHEFAKKGAKVEGIDYSKDGVALANKALRYQNKGIKKRLNFKVMNAKKLVFKDNAFDVVTAIDVFEHLYKEELDDAMKEIYRVLKPNGRLFVHTDTNKIYLDFTHKLWCYPLSYVLIKINKLITDGEYKGLEKDPRNDFHKKQHVNEPTYIYLRSLFNKHNFRGQVKSEIPYKPILSWKDRVYNMLVLLHPISKYYPIKALFEADYFFLLNSKNYEIVEKWLFLYFLD